jgi:hypothetical protein
MLRNESTGVVRPYVPTSPTYKDAELSYSVSRRNLNVSTTPSRLKPIHFHQHRLTRSRHQNHRELPRPARLRIPTWAQPLFMASQDSPYAPLLPTPRPDPASILLQFLAVFGNLVGRGPHCMVDATRHGLNLFVVLVGDSSKARKGTSWSQIARLFAEVDHHWLSTRVTAKTKNRQKTNRGLVALIALLADFFLNRVHRRLRPGREPKNFRLG